MTPAEKLAGEKHRTPTKPNCDGVSNRLREMRNTFGLKLCDVAEAVGLSTQGLQVIEVGNNGPRLKTAMLLARFYGVRVEDIWTLTDGEPEARTP